MRERILLFKRCKLLSPEVVDAHDAHPCASPDGLLLAVQIGYPANLSLNANATVSASERLHWKEKDQQLIFWLPKPRPNGQTVLMLISLEFLDKLSLLIPPPRKHRHCYHGVLAPNAPLRQW